MSKNTNKAADPANMFKPQGAEALPDSKDVVLNKPVAQEDPVEMSSNAKAAIAAIEAADLKRQTLKRDGYVFFEAAAGCFNSAMPDGKPINFIAGGNYHTNDEEQIAFLRKEFCGDTGPLKEV